MYIAHLYEVYMYIAHLCKVYMYIAHLYKVYMYVAQAVDVEQERDASACGDTSPWKKVRATSLHWDHGDCAGACHDPSLYPYPYPLPFTPCPLPHTPCPLHPEAETATLKPY